LRYLMAGSIKLVATLIGGIVMLSAGNARGWQSSSVTEDVRQESSGVPASTIRRTAANMPPNPPKVSCEGGNLTISATNSTMGAVLNAIHNCTGAQIEIPEGAKGERLFAELGPGPVRAVLADFLSSTDFNFVIKASPSDPQKVQMVLLNPRANDSTKELAPEVASNDNMSSNRRAWMEARRNYEQSVSPPDEDSTPPADAPSSTPPAVETPVAPTNSPPAEAEPVNPAPAAPGIAPASPSIAPASPSEISSADAVSSNSSSVGKSTQEMISDMQRLFEKRKQMAQQQPATVP
jgi:hypothetical protein